jgi:AbrB family looped-hinge helix DNA binding protein
MKKDKQLHMSSVKIGPKGQIVIPKEVRDMFGVGPGDSMVLLADSTRGITLQTYDALDPMLKEIFSKGAM